MTYASSFCRAKNPYICRIRQMQRSFLRFTQDRLPEQPPQDDSFGGFSAACKAPVFQSRGEKSGPNLKPSLRTISLRLPEPLIARLKVLANQRDVPYQSLLKVLLAERLKQALARGG